MSLIPSESYSFPDHFTSTRAASRKPKVVQAEPEPAEPLPPTRPAIVALPNPEPHPGPARVVAKPAQEPVRKIAPPVPNPALRRATAPPARIPEQPLRKIALPANLKPKVRWNNRAPVANPALPIASNGNGNGAEESSVTEMPPMPAQNVIQMRPPPPAPPPISPQPRNIFPANPRPILPQAARPEKLFHNPPPIPPVKAPAKMPAPAPKPAVRPAAVVHPSGPAQVQPEAPQTDFFEMFAENGQTVVWKRRRSEKMKRFILCESIVLAVLIPLAVIGLLFHPQNAALHWMLNILTITAAVAAALIPIIFFAATPTLPEIER